MIAELRRQGWTAKLRRSYALGKRRRPHPPL